jgi:hypothetical protein
MTLSGVLSRQGRLDDAIASARRACELAPANDGFRRGLDALLAERDKAAAAAPAAEAPALAATAPPPPPPPEQPVAPAVAEPAPAEATPAQPVAPPPKRKRQWRFPGGGKPR